MTNEQKLVAKEYKALKSSGLCLGEVYNALSIVDELICRRMNLITALLSHMNNGSERELNEFTRFRNYAVRLRERLTMIDHLCGNDVDEYIMLMDASADRIIGTDEGNNDK